MIMQDILTGKRIVFAIVAFVLFIGVNLAMATKAGWRLDLTEDRLYTLSDGTKNILEDIEKPVHLTFYYSQNLGQEVPSYGLYANRVRDMLHEFQSISNGKVTVKEVNPVTFSEEEDQAVEDGMEGVPLDASGETVYLGLSGRQEGAEKNASIPFFQPNRERFLEYDLAKLVYGLAHPQHPVVGVITGTQAMGDYAAMMQGREPTPWAAIAQAQDFFKIEQIFEPGDFLEMKPDILAVINPAKLDDEMLYAIDQFMMRGGRAVFFLDPWYETAAAGRPGYAPQSSETALNKLFDKWGISIAKGKVVGDRTLGRPVNAGKDGQTFAAPYVAWLEPKADNIDQNDAILASVDQLLIPSAGDISLKDGSPLAMTPLITTTADSALIDVEKLRQPDVMGLLKDFKADDRSHILAARISGTVQTAFPDGPPPPPKKDEEAKADDPAKADSGDKADETASAEDQAKKEEEKPKFLPHVAQSKQPINAIVVADTDMLTDRFWVQVTEFFGQRVMVPFGDNGALFVNALENLNGSGDLISLRSRGTGQRPFTRIEEIRKAAENQYRAKEQALSQKLDATEKKLADLRKDGKGEPIAVEGDPESEKAMKSFTEDLLATRKQLRAVNHELRQDIEQLENRVIFLNIVAVPLLVAIAAFVLGWMRNSRRRRKAA